MGGLIAIGVVGLVLSAVSTGVNLLTGRKAQEEENKRYQRELYNTATSWRQTAASIDAQAETFGHQAEDAGEQAELYYDNAENKLDTGTDIYKQAAQSYDVKKTGLSANMGATTAAVGRSSMEFQGSGDRLLIENARQMTRDLTVLRNITSSKWDAMMGQRNTDILSGENSLTTQSNLLESQATYEGRADEYISSAVDLENEADDVDTSVSWGDYLF
jgi:hypothetical protein